MSDINIPSTIQTKKGFNFGYRDLVIQQEKSPGPIYHVNDSFNFC